MVSYGNDTQAAETQSILQALERIKRMQDPDGFQTWLAAGSKRAEKEGLLTYLSRLVVYQNSRLSDLDAKEAALLKLADLVPLDQLDPEALGQVGLMLTGHEPTKAEPFLAYLIEYYPKSATRAMGYLGLAKLAFKEENFEGARALLDKAEGEVPAHPHMNEAKLLLGNVLSQLHEYDSSIETFEKLLRLKSARGRPHAQALAGIAQAHLGMENPEKASAYYQRIYNMYRAYPDLVSQAYLQSAQLFESMNRIPDAVNTLEEMLAETKLEAFPEWEFAKQKLEQLLPLMPKEENETPVPSHATKD
ncbi:MAG: tetratricopeptide repeat protein [Opitutales bacterium]|nr:tetratricopeptide repeat protein [Opitutales bacterium]